MDNPSNGALHNSRKQTTNITKNIPNTKVAK